MHVKNIGTDGQVFTLKMKGLRLAPRFTFVCACGSVLNVCLLAFPRFAASRV